MGKPESRSFQRPTDYTPEEKTPRNFPSKTETKPNTAGKVIKEILEHYERDHQKYITPIDKNVLRDARERKGKENN